MTSPSNTEDVANQILTALRGDDGNGLWSGQLFTILRDDKTMPPLARAWALEHTPGIMQVLCAILAARSGLPTPDEGHPHLIGGEFQSDKYLWCKRDFVPLKVTDKTAQPFLWGYAGVRAAIDIAFEVDLKLRLTTLGYAPEGRKP